MSRELEAWQEIKSGYICGQGATNEFALRENERENFQIIETTLKNYEWLKSKLSIDFFNKLPTEDKFRLLEILGVEINI